MKELVQLWKRPTYDGKRYTYYLLYTDEQGRRRQKALGHADARKAERKQKAFERELRMGNCASGSLRLSEFAEDSLRRTGKQIRESTKQEYQTNMKDFIKVIGNMDYQNVELRHGEAYVQACFDRGNTPDTVAKKVRTIKRFFNLAMERGQLYENPLRYLKQPRRLRKRVRTFTEDECQHLVKAASEWKDPTGFHWDLLIILALTTGLRKGELLNLTWANVDFARNTVIVTAKKDTQTTWQWEIKDAEERLLPITEEVIALLADHQARQPEGHPYVFLTPKRYEAIMKQKHLGDWSTISARVNIVGNSYRIFKQLLKRAGIEKDATFHDLRRTALSDWLRNGMSVLDVMNLAGHSKLETTQKFYLDVSDDMIDRARASKTRQIDQKLLQICCKCDLPPFKEEAQQL